MGQGAYYLYHGHTSLIGVHTKDKLKINSRDKGIITIKTPEEIFPEYFIIRVNEFSKVAKTPLEEWLDYLKSGHIKEDTKAPGLQEAREKLQYLKMSKAERKAYDRHIDNIMVQNDVLDTAKMEGREEGREEGRKEGRKEGREEGREEGRKEGRKEGREEAARETAKNLKAMGLDVETIAKATGLSTEEIAKL